MTIETEIETRLASLNPVKLELENESHKHAHGGPAPTDTHFRLLLVSDAFEGMRAVQRHQKIYALLGDLMQNPIHALAMRLSTPAEWNPETDTGPAPMPCRGGSKR